jgi:hypothetical protein
VHVHHRAGLVEVEDAVGALRRAQRLALQLAAALETPLILEIAKTEKPFDRERWMRERRLRRTTKD